MFCPACKAEYRPGFYRCADCDVALVDALPDGILATPAWENTAVAGSYPVQLWQGSDPALHLALLNAVWSCGIRCLGRPASAPTLNRSGEPFYPSAGAPTFEILVSEASAPFARWMLDSAKETFAESRKTEGAIPAPTGELRDHAVSKCSLCAGEFPADTPYCPNCGVALKLSYEKSPYDLYVRLLCNLPHPGFTYAIRSALHDAGIPFNNANYFGRDLILGRREVPSDGVLVSDLDYERALQVLSGVLQNWEFEPGSGLQPLPPNPLQPSWPARATSNGWFPEDLTAAAWSGQNLGTLISIASAMREHEIPYVVDVAQMGAGKLMVHPEDEVGAREIAAQVVEGVPPVEV